jgi:hypothetical protein
MLVRWASSILVAIVGTLVVESSIPAAAATVSDSSISATYGQADNNSWA